MTDLVPCRLQGEYVALEPLKSADADGLLKAGEDLDWSLMMASLETRQDVVRWIDATQRREETKGEDFTFVVRLRDDRKNVFASGIGPVVGVTRYLDIQADHRGVEIGGTWYALSVQGTVVNPESKYLLLLHAFDDWGAIRVQLKTDVRNVHSQRAILKLGAKFEGRLRNHRIRRDGTARDTMMYSITNGEWPEVKSKLEDRIRQWKPVGSADGP